MLTLNSDDKKWLKNYLEILKKEYPKLVKDIIIFGSKARGDVHNESDLDVIIIIENGDNNLKRNIRYFGYDLALETETVPSILVYTQNEWQQHKQNRSIFQEIVEQEGVSMK